MRNWKTTVKLIVSFLIVIVMSIAVGLVGIYGMSSISNADKRLYEDNLLAIDALGTMRENYASQRSSYRDYILYDSSSAEFQNARTTMQSLEQQMVSSIAEYKSHFSSTEEETQYKAFDVLYNGEFKDIKEQLYTLGSQNETEQSMALIQGRGKDVVNELKTELEKCYNINKTQAENAVAANANLFSRMTVVAIAVLALAVVMAMYLAVHISKLISRPAKYMNDVLMKIGTRGDLDFTDEEYKQAERYAQNKDEIGESVGMLLTTVRRLVKVGSALGTVAGGDLTAELSLLSDRDTMGSSLQRMVANLNDMFGEINNSTRQVSSGAKQIADGAQALAQGSTEQAAAVEELSSSISDIAEKTKENANKAMHAAKLGNTIKGSAEKGSQQMDQMMNAVREINEASQNINRVIKVIDDIAFQTNILALNAAVEAARAGQHGKGFAVVAEEVRSLAAKSAEAAKDTGGLIVNSMEKAELGARIAGETAASLAEIVSGINESSRIVGDIAVSSEEQSVAISQINNGIDQVAQVVQQNSATAEQSAAASEEMSGQSSVLEELILQFKLKDRPDMNYGRQQRAFTPSKPPAQGITTPAGNYGKY